MQCEGPKDDGERLAPVSQAPQTAFARALQSLTGLPQKHAVNILKTATAISLAEGEVLFKKGEIGNGCFLLERGLLKVSIASDRGEQRILAFLGPGSIVGELAMIDGLPRSATVEAHKECRLHFVSRTAFAQCVEATPRILDYVVVTLAARLRRANDETAASSFLTVKARVARALLHLAEHLGQKDKSGKTLIAHNLRQEDIAAMAGIARENVSRTLSEWRRHNVIAKKSAFNYMIDEAALRREAMPEN
jgi:CRP/FNR family cyclic AMP-dependent transcriptional regulator